MPNETEISELREALEREKERLEKSLSSFAKRDPKDASNWNARYPEISDEGADRLDADENADEVEEYDTLLESEETLETRLRDVNRALENIGGSSYGACESCGSAILMERLRANPAARFCIEHAN